MMPNIGRGSNKKHKAIQPVLEIPTNVHKEKKDA